MEVGSFEGDTDGVDVGLVVGDLEGDSVPVGKPSPPLAFVGLDDGLDDGALVGLDDGLDVGFEDGLDDGALEGAGY